MIRKPSITVGVIGIIACVGLFLIPQSRNTVTYGLFWIMRPVLLYGSDARNTFQSFQEYLTSYGRLVRDTQELKNENLHLKSQMVDYEILKQENQELRKNISFIQTEPYGFMSSRVLGSFADPTGLFLVINGGKNDGISGGTFVLAGDRVLVGKIATLYPELATVSLLQNLNTTLGIFIIPQQPSLGTATSTQNRKSVEGLLIGKGNDLIVDLVPNSADVRVGDLVITNGFGEGGVRGLLVGEIATVKKQDATVFQEIHVREAAQLSSLQNVLILTEKKR